MATTPPSARKATGGPAFPSPNQLAFERGLSVRDYFAAESMKNFIGSNAWLAYTDQELEAAFSKISRVSYLMADAMIAERNRT